MKLSSLLPTLALGVLLPALAAADSTADRASARELGKDGQAALAQKDYPTALERFTRAEALFHAPTLLLGLARAQAGMGKLVDAQESYRRVINERLPANAPAAFTEAVTAATAELGVVAGRVAWLTIIVSGTEAVPSVKVDGQGVPATALGVRRAVDPGTHKIVGELQSGVRKSVTVSMGEGKSETATLDLSASSAAPLAPSASSGAPLPPASTAPPAPRSSSTLRKTLGFVSIGVGGAGLVVGATAGALALSQHSTLAPDCNGGKCPASLVPKVDNYNTLGAVSTAAFIAGGALAVLGVVLVVTTPSAGRTVGLTVSPTLGCGALGAAGSF